MKFLILLITWASLTTQGQAARIKLQRGVLDRGVIESIAKLQLMNSPYRDWNEKQQWLRQPDTYPDPELGKLLTHLGVSGEEFLQGLTEFGEIYPAIWRSPPVDQRTLRYGEKLRQLNKDEFPSAILYELAVDNSEEELELFARLLEEPQALLAQAQRRITFLTEILARVRDPILDLNEPILVHASAFRAGRIGLNWETYMRIIYDDAVSPADFVYLRYAIGEDRRANFMFDELLTEYDMSRTEFDEFFAANKDNYADLHKRKDIMNKLLDVVLTSTSESEQEDLAHAMYEQLGINTQWYSAYVYEGHDLPLWLLARIEQGIGAEKELRTPLDKLLLDNGVPRAEFEQALAEVFSVYSIWYPYNHSDRAMTRNNLLNLIGGGFHPAGNHFEALITKAGNLASPEKARTRSAILQQMLTAQEPTQAYFHTRIKQLGIRDSTHHFFPFLFADESRVINPKRYSYLDTLVNMRYAISTDQQLNTLFNSLLVEYSLSRAKFDKFFAAHKDAYVGFHWPPEDIPFREMLAAAAEGSP